MCIVARCCGGQLSETSTAPARLEEPTSESDNTNGMSLDQLRQELEQIRLLLGPEA